jgi:DNA modification methylase
MHQPLEANVLLGDCLQHLKEMPESHFDLIYLDPPFSSGRRHALQPRDRSCTFHFDDSWATVQAYGAFILDRLHELHRVLKPTGSIYFHCDRSASHLVRSALDQVFGADNFRSEIIWYYRRPTRPRDCSPLIKTFCITRNPAIFSSTKYLRTILRPRTWIKYFSGADETAQTSRATYATLTAMWFPTETSGAFRWVTFGTYLF